MAVYTQISTADLQDLIAEYNLGELVSYKGIDGGIENTNYFVTLNNQGTEHEYVLTLFEEFSMEDMPFFVELATWLADRGLPVPAPAKDKNGIALKKVKNKPAMLQNKLSGHHLEQEALTPEHCAAIGTKLAEMHMAAKDFFLKRQSHRGLYWWRRESVNIAKHLPAEDVEILQDEVARFEELLQKYGKELPLTVIHGDLFHDNALFSGNEVDAIIDLYNAATAYMLFDLAIVANDWCRDADNKIDAVKESALLEAYNNTRPFSETERTVWPQMTRTAAMRFWLSRLIPAFGVVQENRDSSDMVIKDPAELKTVLLYRRNHPSSLPDSTL